MSYQEKYLKYKSKYLNLKAEIHNTKLENKVFQNGGSLTDILDVNQLSGTVSVSEKHFLMLGGSNNTDSDNLPDQLTATPKSESSSSKSESSDNLPEKLTETPTSSDKSSSSVG